MLQSDGNTSFLRAARNGQLDKVLEHLKSNIDINTSNAVSINPFLLSIILFFRNAEISKVLTVQIQKFPLCSTKFSVGMKYSQRGGLKRVPEILKNSTWENKSCFFETVFFIFQNNELHRIFIYELNIESMSSLLDVNPLIYY